METSSVIPTKAGKRNSRLESAYSGDSTEVEVKNEWFFIFYCRSRKYFSLNCLVQDYLFVHYSTKGPLYVCAVNMNVFNIQVPAVDIKWCLSLCF